MLENTAIDPARRDYFWIERILDGQPLLVPGCGNFAYQQVYVRDVARAFADLPEREAAIGQVYNVAAEEIFSLNDYLKALSRLLSRDPPMVHIDQEVFDHWPLHRSSHGDIFPFNTRRTAIFSLERIKRDLNYRATPFRAWMAETVDWFVNRCQGHSHGYEHRGQEVALARRWERHKQSMAGEFLISDSGGQPGQ